MQGRVEDSKTQLPLSDILVKVSGKNLKETLHVKTDSSGSFTQVLGNPKQGERLDLTVEFSKKGYVSKTIPIALHISESNVIKVHDKLN